MRGSLTVHFVRHGESHSNASEKVALPDAEGDRLTAAGREQARLAGAHLRDSGAKRLLTSPLRRARETAAILAEELGLEPEVVPDLAEIAEGDDYGSLGLEQQMARRWSERMAAGLQPVAGADSFDDLLGRVQRFKASLEDERSSPLVAVGHGIFLRFFLADSLLGTAFTPGLAGRLWQLASRNGAISTFERTEADRLRVPIADPWRCVTWMQPPRGL